MAQMRNALRAQLFASMSPSESLGSLSSLLAIHEPDSFATIICVVVDPESGDVTWASAGHPAPILVSGDGASAYLPGQPGPPIGWIDSRSPEPCFEHRLTLNAADRLILFTDGLIERRGTNLDIGITHLMILAEQTRSTDAASACETILHDILSVSYEDDVCLLIADYTPSS
jgi:serine phosphatase RsbU (regulator of sigma subunit)